MATTMGIDIFLLMLIGVITTIVVMLSYAVYYFFGTKDRHRILYCRMKNKVPTVHRRRWASPNMKHYTVGSGKAKRTFDFDISTPIFKRRNVYFYLCDTQQGQIKTTASPKGISPELRHSNLVSNLARQLVAGLNDAPMLENIMMIVLILVAGIAVGYIMGNFVPMGK